MVIWLLSDCHIKVVQDLWSSCTFGLGSKVHHLCACPASCNVKKDLPSGRKRLTMVVFHRAVVRWFRVSRLVNLLCRSAGTCSNIPLVLAGPTMTVRQEKILRWPRCWLIYIDKLLWSLDKWTMISENQDPEPCCTPSIWSESRTPLSAEDQGFDCDLSVTSCDVLHLLLKRLVIWISN